MASLPPAALPEPPAACGAQISMQSPRSWRQGSVPGGGTAPAAPFCCPDSGTRRKGPGEVPPCLAAPPLRPRPERTRAGCTPWLALIIPVVPGAMSVSQCPKEDGRSSSGPAHEPTAPKRTYDMMEGRVGRALASASIEGGHRTPQHPRALRLPLWSPVVPRSLLFPAHQASLSSPGGRRWDGQHGETVWALRGSTQRPHRPGRRALARQVLCRLRCEQRAPRPCRDAHTLSRQVSWAAPSHPSATAHTISESSITCAAPSRKVPACARSPTGDP